MIKEIKNQESKIKISNKNLTFLVVICNFAFCFLSFAFTSYAQEITIVYTGETHAMLYPCNCPIEPDGGVARRASLIKQVRLNNPDTLVLDSGGFFSGGLQDGYAQNSDLDKQRAIVNLKAMELMKYDAVVIGDDEFNFGRDFLENNIAKTNIAFLACNIYDTVKKQEPFKPYIIREMAGDKIGIIGVTNPIVAQKVSNFKFIEPKLAVREAVEKLKKENVNIIILLSHLGESEDLDLMKDVEGIDILVVGHSRAKEESFSRINHTLIVRSSWQGRKLGKLIITLKDNKIANFKIEEIRLSDKIADDPDMLSILPRCFSDNNCKQEGSIGTCLDAGNLKSKCAFYRAPEVPLLVITTRLCMVCNTEGAVRYLKSFFPGLTASYLYYPDSKAKKIINNIGIEALPVYLLGKEAAKDANFEKFKENLLIKGNYYLIKPQYMGFGYFLSRKNMKGRLDLFLSLYDKNAPALLDMVKGFNPEVHFLAIGNADGSFKAQGGNLEVEEDLRSACVQKYYPQKYWDYISCRVKSIDSSWWQDCLSNSEGEKIMTCARTEEGKELLKKNISLNKELQIMSGPVFLLDNQQIFGIRGVPKKEEFKKIIKR